MKKISIVLSLALAVFFCGQIIQPNTSLAHIQCGSVMVEEGTIQKIDGGIEVFVMKDEYMGYLMRFEKRNGIWYCAKSTNARVFKGWHMVSTDKQANDILYVVLQYV